MRTEIGNVIRIYDPTDEVRQWCRDNLVVDNPEYQQRLKMNMWLGRTPKTLELYERRGNTLVLPYGTMDEIWPMIRNCPYTASFAPERHVDMGGTDVPLYDYQESAVEAMFRAKSGILQSPAGSGKGLPLNAKVYTPDGFTRNGDLKVGDEVLNTYGGVSKVTAIYDRGKQYCYRVTFTDDASIICDKDHLWTVRNTRSYNKKWETVSTEELYRKPDLKRSGGGNVYEIPITQPVSFRPRKVTIDPWLLGALLGDGNISQTEVSISNNEPDILDRVKRVANCGTYQRKDRVSTVLLDKGSLHYRLVDYGLQGKHSWDKFIPKDYIYNTVEVRLGVLRGIIDTDGSVDKNNQVTVTSTSKQLMNDCLEIVQSLGGTGKISARHTRYTYKGETRESRESYRLTLKLYLFEPFSSEKHKAHYHGRTKYVNAYRRVKSITLTAPHETRCITVDSNDALYLTDGFVATHNTQMAIALIKRFSQPTLWLTHTADLLNQSRDRALLYVDREVVGTITGGKVDIGTGVTFATVQTMCKLDLAQYRDTWNVVVADECFPGNTMVETAEGPKRIDSIQAGDEVLTLTLLDNPTHRRVKRVFVRKPETLVTVFYGHGKKLTCTANHPVLTKGGYVCAGQLKRNDAVCCMRETCIPGESEQYAKKLCTEGETEASLFNGVLDDQPDNESCVDAGTKKSGVGKHESHEPEEHGTDRRKNDEKKPVVRPCREGKDIERTEENRSQTDSSRWERYRDDSAAKDDDGSACGLWAYRGACDPDKDVEGRISPVLQGGHCDTFRNALHRIGRRVALFAGRKRKGREEGSLLEWHRVDRVEVQEQTGDGTFGGLCPDCLVYNLEVEETHNYFANGVNVHNCHHTAGSPTRMMQFYKVLNSLSARHKYGLSATVHRSDGMIRSTYAILGPVKHAVPDIAVSSRVMTVTHIRVDTGTPESDDYLLPDGTISYTYLINYLCGDPFRNALIVKYMVENEGQPSLVLSHRLEHLRELMELLPPSMREQAVMVSGTMTSKTGRAKREQAIEDMREGRKTYLFATYSLAKEGLDIPRLTRLYMATPAKDEAVIIQSIGRVARTFPGKNSPRAYDFVDDNIRFCEYAYKARARHARKCGCITA